MVLEVNQSWLAWQPRKATTTGILPAAGLRSDGKAIYKDITRGLGCDACAKNQLHQYIVQGIRKRLQVSIHVLRTFTDSPFHYLESGVFISNGIYDKLRDLGKIDVSVIFIFILPQGFYLAKKE